MIKISKFDGKRKKKLKQGSLWAKIPKHKTPILTFGLHIRHLITKFRIRHVLALEAKPAELTKAEMEEVKKRGTLDRKLRTMIREILWQLILLALMLWVATGNRDGNMYLQNAHLKHIFVDELPEVIIAKYN